MGIKAAWELRCEQRLWRAWVLLLQRLKARLRYTAEPIQEILRTVDRTGLESLVWLSEWDHDGGRLAVPQTVAASEKGFVHDFFASLGTTDLEGQLMHIEQFEERASRALADADVAFASRAKPYLMTGVCVGACVGLCLL